jgi:glycosyltransferase involved in cell wall biosynthesis
VGPCLVRGGAEQWLVDLSRFLDPQRVRMLRTIVTMPECVDPGFLESVPVPVEVGQAEAVRRAAGECDVLLCWGIQLDDWLADCKPKTCVFVAHGEGEWTRQLLANSARVVDHVVAVSYRVKEKVSNGVPTTVIYNGVDAGRLGRTQSRDAMRSSLGFRPTDFVLGYVGRFSGEKRVDMIVDAVSQLPPCFKLLLVGWGADRWQLMDVANSKIPGRYAFATAAQYLGDYYQAMESLCLVSDQEGDALVVLEAMMCERPVIVTPVGSVPEIIQHRINGVIVDGSSASIVEAARLLKEHPACARAIASEAKMFVDQHGHALRMARDYENLLHKLSRREAAASQGLV